jgi:hypothetical protein
LPWSTYLRRTSRRKTSIHHGINPGWIFFLRGGAVTGPRVPDLT